MLVLVVLSMVVVLGIYVMYGYVDWWMGIFLVLGGLLSIFWGVRLVYVLFECSLCMVFCVFFVLCVVFLLVCG